MSTLPQIPSRQEILDWLSEHPGASSKRDIAKAFGIKGPQKVELKRILKQMEDEGLLAKRRR